MTWSTIETAPPAPMAFLAIAPNPLGIGWTDTYTVWRAWAAPAKDNAKLVTEPLYFYRWPHPFPPTHWHPVLAPPNPPKRTFDDLREALLNCAGMPEGDQFHIGPDALTRARTEIDRMEGRKQPVPKLLIEDNEVVFTWQLAEAKAYRFLDPEGAMDLVIFRDET